jgi:hypothetical protein
VPVALHVSSTLPVHCNAPGVHPPVQAPDTHAWVTHAIGTPQARLESHVCTPLPEHSVDPGVHGPEHCPAVHVALAHGAAVDHCPSTPHV